MGLVIPQKEEEENHFKVSPDAWEAANVFLMVQTQWRASSGSVYGLDYSAVRWASELLEVKKPLEVLMDLQVIEAKVVETLSRRSE